jgi:hypothetical protein
MTENTPFDAEVDPWVIPLHGAVFPVTSADAGATPPILGVAGPGAEGVPSMYVATLLEGYAGSSTTDCQDDDEIPYLGFHPRLRRSA